MASTAPSAYWLTTQLKVDKFDYEWEITEFSVLIQDHYETVYGPVIRICEIPPDIYTYWNLNMVLDQDGFLYIKVSIMDKSYISLTYRPTLESRKQVSMGLQICDANRTKIPGKEFTKVPQKFQILKEGLSFKLIHLDMIMKDPALYLPNDTLTVLCTIHYLSPESYEEDTGRLETPSSDVVWLMQNVLKKSQFSDVVITAGGKEFPAHRAILAECSDVFRTMFNADMVEKRDGRVTIKDLSAEVMSDLLTYVYTDCAPNVRELASELLVAAEKYNISRLKVACEEELMRTMEVDNVVDRLIESDMNSAFQLRDAALQFVVQHAAGVVKQASWEPLCRNYPHLVKFVCEKMALYTEDLKKRVGKEEIEDIETE